MAKTHRTAEETRLTTSVKLKTNQPPNNLNVFPVVDKQLGATKKGSLLDVAILTGHELHDFNLSFVMLNDFFAAVVESGEFPEVPACLMDEEFPHARK